MSSACSGLGACPGSEENPAAPEEAPIVLRYEHLARAQLVRRYKRFLGDVQLEAAAVAGGPAAGGAGGAGSLDASAGLPPPTAAPAAAEAGLTTVHVPNTGPMTGLLDALPAPALLSVSTDPKRKYKHTLEWLRPKGEQGSWVGTHSAKANAMVRCLLDARLLPGLPPYAQVQAEVRYGTDGKSRVDFVLHPEGEGGSTGGSSCAAGAFGGAPAKRRRSRAAAAAGAAAEAAAGTLPSSAAAATALQAAGAQAAAGLPLAGQRGSCFLEVKSVTLAEDHAQGRGRIALFPDTVSERAQRHVRELTALAAAGGSAALVFVVQRADCSAFAPCHEKDPEYGLLVREAAAAGVALLPVVCCLDEAAGAVRYHGTLPVDLEYKWKAC